MVRVTLAFSSPPGVTKAGLALGMLSILTGCCVFRPYDISDDPGQAYNFVSLLRGRCFQTTRNSVFSYNYYLEPTGPTGPTGQGLIPDSVSDYEEAAANGRLGKIHAIVAAGTRFRVIRLVRDCGDTAGLHVEALVLGGPLEGRTVDVRRFFLERSIGDPSESIHGFIIGPDVVPCSSFP